MPRTVSLTNITEDIRQRCDLPTFSSTTFITSTAVTRMINESLQSLYSVVADAYGDGYFTTSASVTASANTATSNLPSDFLRLVSLVWNRGTDDIVPLREASVDDYPLAQYAARAWDAPMYRLRQSTILWLPKPNATYTLTMEYVQSPADLSGGSDTFDGGPGWAEWVALDVSRKIFERQEKDSQHFAAERGRVEAMIRSQAPSRQETQYDQVRDAWDAESMGTRELRNLLWRGGF